MTESGITTTDTRPEPTMIRLVAATLAILALAALLGSTIAVFAFGLLLFVAGVRLLDADVSIWDGYVPGY